jgi:hypothetical protein
MLQIGYRLTSSPASILLKVANFRLTTKSYSRGSACPLSFFISGTSTTLGDAEIHALISLQGCPRVQPTHTPFNVVETIESYVRGSLLRFSRRLWHIHSESTRLAKR